MDPALKERNTDLVKVAVVILSAPGKPTQFLELNQKQPITSNIADICASWDIPDPENYVLQTFDSKKQYYITDDNKCEIKKGSILRLELSPTKNVQDILTAINNNSTFDQYAAIAKLSYLSVDLTFAKEFFNQEGLTLLMKYIEQDKYRDNALKYALNTFIELMRHGIINWDTLEDSFINKIASYVNKQPTIQDKKILDCCLSILEKIVLYRSISVHLEKNISIHNLLQHLQNPNQDCKFQLNIISLINAIFSKADITRKTIIAAMLSSKQCRSIIHESLIGAKDCPKTIIKKPSGTELIHKLYVLQTHVLSLLALKMRQRADAQKQESQNKIKQLRKIAFGSDLSLKGAIRRPLGATFPKCDYNKLGFTCEEDQIKDFNEVPPGILALDCVLYFAKNYSKDYRNIVQKNNCKGDEHEWPFGKMSVQLVKSICAILHIGEPPSEQGQSYYPFVFSHEKPFEEIFCVCIVVLDKTWEDTKATTEDMPKVLSVVSEQLSKTLSAFPKDFNEFRDKMNQKPYAEITKLWARIRRSCRKKVGNFV